MVRLTSRQKQEVVSTFYGINPETLRVDSVSVTREGRLTRRGLGVPCHTHLIHRWDTPRSAIAIVFHLEQVIELPMHLWHHEDSKRRVDELRARASAMRAERDARRVTTGSYHRSSPSREPGFG